MNYFQTMDVTGVVVLVLGVALGGLLIGVGAAWRELQSAMRELPLHVALRRFEVGLSADGLRTAELRCALCPLQQACMRGLVRYEGLPADCPNGAAFRAA